MLTDSMDQSGEYIYTCRTTNTAKQLLHQYRVCVFGELTVENFHCRSNLNNLICECKEQYACKNTLHYELMYSYDSTLEHRMCNRNKYPEANLSRKKVHCSLQLQQSLYSIN